MKKYLPVIILGIGIFGFIGLRVFKPSAKKGKPRTSGVLVSVLDLSPTKTRLQVPAQGTVVPAQEIDIQSEVSGRVIWQSPELQPGGFFRRGEVLFQVDSRDYRVAVEQQKAATDKASLDLQLESGRKVVARREWELMSEDRGSSAANAPPNALALREPQYRSAEVALSAAQSKLEQARINLSRTSVVAPFDGIVLSEVVDLGQVVNPQMRLGKLVNVEQFWVEVSIPVETLDGIRVPRPGQRRTDGEGGEALGAPVVVWQRVGDQRIERKGHLVRLMAEVERAGRMVKLLVEIPDPMGVSEPVGEVALAEGNPGPVDTVAAPGENPVPASELSTLPLLLGSYVNVEIQGVELERVYQLPRHVVRNGAQIHVLDGDKRLAIRDIEVVWRTSDFVYARFELSPAEKIVKSTIPNPVEGIELRLPGEKAPNSATAQKVEG